MYAAPTVNVASRPTDLLTVAALLQPPQHGPDFQAELAAVCELAELTAQDPRAALRRFLETAIRLCNAGTAGLSLLRPNAAGQTMVRWEVVSGALASQEGSDSSRDFSPCGLCLDAGLPIVVSRPERVFIYLQAAQPAIIEDLIVPLYDSARRALGTFWIARHDGTVRFNSNDARIMEQLASQMVLTLKLLQQAEEHGGVLALLELHKKAHRNIARNLAEERDRRERAEGPDSEVRQALVFKDAAVVEAHHRVKNTLQIAASLLSLQSRTTPSAEARAALDEGYRRLHLLAKVHELLYRSIESTHEIHMPHLLRVMGDALRQSFAERSAFVRLQITCQQIMLPPDEAVPLALLVNEAITNAYKHGFPNNACGEIIVDLSCGAQRSLLLRIADSGIGMRPGRAETGLGLKLIRRFAAQLRGALVLNNPLDMSGTTVMLTIHRSNTRHSQPDARDAEPAAGLRLEP